MPDNGRGRRLKAQEVLRWLWRAPSQPLAALEVSAGEAERVDGPTLLCQ